MSLWIFSAESGEIREIATDLRRFTRPCWAPDGRSIFVVGGSSETYIAIHRIDIGTGRSTFFVDSERDANIKFIAPSRNGQSVYYTYFEFGKKQARIMSVDLATRTTRELYRQAAPPDIGGLSLSPDGSELVFGTLDPEDSMVMKAIPLRGGPSREIIRTRAGAFGVSVEVHGAFCWTPDGKHILFFRDVPGGKKNERELCFIPAEGGDVQSLGLILDRTPVVFSLHPDGRRLAFSASREGAEIWMMENFLPENIGRR